MKSIFHPSARILLSIRFEDFIAGTGSLLNSTNGSTAGVSVPSGQINTSNAQQLLTETSEAMSLTNQIRSTLSPTTYDNIMRGLTQRQSDIQEFLLDGGESPSASTPNEFNFAIQAPLTVDVERNSFVTADTASFSIDWKDAPFDPRLFRSAIAEITIGVQRPELWERGMRGERRADGSLYSVVGESHVHGPYDTTRQTVDEFGENDLQSQGLYDRAHGTTRFVGVVDEWTVNYEMEGPKISAKLRDLSAIFHDQPLDPSRQLNLLLPIADAVETLCRQYVSLDRTRIRFGDPINVVPVQPDENGNLPAEDRGPIIANNLNVLRARRGRVAQQRRSGDQEQSVWDHIVEACQRAGFIPIFYDWVLWIAPSRALMSGDSPRKARRLIFGQNLTRLDFTRKLQGQRVPTIDVRCFDPAIGRTRWARYPAPTTGPASGVIGISDPPQTPQRISNASPAGWKPSENIKTVIINGSPTGEYMQQVARQYFEQSGRSEIEGNFTTEAFESVNAEDFYAFDLLQIDSGDGVELGIYRLMNGQEGVTNTTSSQIESMETEARTDYLVSLGFQRRVAQAYARLYASSGLQSFYCVRNAKIKYDHEDGVEITCDFQNFVVVRENQITQLADVNIVGNPNGNVLQLDDVNIQAGG